MILSYKNIKRVGALSFGLIFLLSTVLAMLPLPTAGAAPADPEVPTFIDKITIAYKDKIWTDSNPYDSRYLYAAGPSSCKYGLTVENWDSGAKVSGEIRGDVSGTGQCEPLEGGTFEDVPLAGTERRNWTAYRISDDKIYLPIGTRKNLGSCPAIAQVSQAEPDNAFIEWLNVAGATFSIDVQGYFAEYDDVVRRGLLVDHGTHYERRDGFPRNQYLADNNAGGDGSGDFDRFNRVQINNNPRGEVDIQPECGVGFGRYQSLPNTTVPNVQLAFDGQAVDENTDRCIFSRYDADEGTCSAENDPAAPGSGSGGDDAGDTSCEDSLSEEGGFGWVICPALGLLDKFADQLIGQITRLLEVDESEYNNPDLRDAWSYFRNIASLVLIIVGLVMVIGQAVSKE